MAAAKGKTAAGGGGAAAAAARLTEGQRAYEARRAAKAGMSLDRWLASKERERAEATKAAAAPAKAAEAAAAPTTRLGKAKALAARLLERANRPLKG